MVMDTLVVMSGRIRNTSLKQGSTILNGCFMQATAKAITAIMQNSIMFESVNRCIPKVLLQMMQYRWGVNERLRLSWTVLPENSFNKNVEFTSSDEETAYVLPDGTVIGLAEGETIITIMAEDGEPLLRAEFP